MLLISTAGAQESPEPLSTDRPDFTEGAETIAPGQYQLEGGVTYTDLGVGENFSLGELLLRIGMNEKTELRVGIPSYEWTDGSGGDISGFSDSSIGAKFLLDEGSGELGLGRPRTAMIVETSLPTGSGDLREDDLQPAVKYLMAWELSETMGMASNINFAWLSDDGDRYGEFSGSLAFAFEMPGSVDPYIEYFGFYPTSGPADTQHYLNAGITYLIHNDLQFDARIGVGLNSDADDLFAGVGFARRW